jgi:regulator of replication initiation timing
MEQEPKFAYQSTEKVKELKFRYELSEKVRNKYFAEIGVMLEPSQTIWIDADRLTQEQREHLLATTKGIYLEYSLGKFDKLEIDASDIGNRITEKFNEKKAEEQEERERWEAQVRKWEEMPVEDLPNERLMIFCKFPEVEDEFTARLDALRKKARDYFDEVCEKDAAELEGLTPEELVKLDVLKQKARDYFDKDAAKPVNKGASYLYNKDRYRHSFLKVREDIKQRFDAIHDRYTREKQRIKENEKARKETEKAVWISRHGSEHLRKLYEGGYDTSTVYAKERAALEYPGFCIDLDDNLNFRKCSQPSLRSLKEQECYSPKPSIVIVSDSHDEDEHLINPEYPEEALLFESYLDEFNLVKYLGMA